jgi:hypothetical protein
MTRANPPDVKLLFAHVLDRLAQRAWRNFGISGVGLRELEDQEQRPKASVVTATALMREDKPIAKNNASAQDLIDRCFDPALRLLSWRWCENER